MGIRGLKWIKVWQQFLYLKNGNDRVPLEIHVHIYNNGLNLRINLISLVYLQPVFVFDDVILLILLGTGWTPMAVSPLVGRKGWLKSWQTPWPSLRYRDGTRKEPSPKKLCTSGLSTRTPKRRGESISYFIWKGFVVF